MYKKEISVLPKRIKDIAVSAEAQIPSLLASAGVAAIFEKALETEFKISKFFLLNF
ncbi:hypothetical protein CSUNSWCD_1567 [Campylobacter showae CSUNSWCD]|uniref:Uncharacterized protein n=1 Tax=Campylobacter showae CSUNSWCD TaxID=1244083 RepID=M5IQI4_9BACT|nr:hypothetical protein CSUNSWCD_1567 [Campylobacter showae CSUNSWCD]